MSQKKSQGQSKNNGVPLKLLIPPLQKKLHNPPLKFRLKGNKRVLEDGEDDRNTRRPRTGKSPTSEECEMDDISEDVVPADCTDERQDVHEDSAEEEINGNQQDARIVSGSPEFGAEAANNVQLNDRSNVDAVRGHHVVAGNERLPGEALSQDFNQDGPSSNVEQLNVSRSNSETTLLGDSFGQSIPDGQQEAANGNVSSSDNGDIPLQARDNHENLQSAVDHDPESVSPAAQDDNGRVHQESRPSLGQADDRLISQHARDSQSPVQQSGIDLYRNELNWNKETGGTRSPVPSEDLATDMSFNSSFSPPSLSISSQSRTSDRGSPGSSSSPTSLAESERVAPSKVRIDALDPKVWAPQKLPDMEERTFVTREIWDDPVMVDTYANLPKLRYAELDVVKKWSDIVKSKKAMDLPGFYDMGAWMNEMPDRPTTLKRIKRALMFSVAAIYYNPSRADPSQVQVEAISKARYIVNPNNPRSCLIGVTTGCCLSSQLILGRTKPARFGGASTVRKIIEIIPHTQEYERLVSFLGTVFDFESVKAPCYSDFVLSFSTRTGSVDEEVSESNTKFRAYLSNRLTARKAPRSTERSASREAEQFIQTSLGHTDEIPIYDARNVDFCLQENIQDISQLPLYKSGTEDVPDGACVSVGYTVGLYKDRLNGKEDNLTLNVRWVVIWATPSIRNLSRQ